MKILEQLKLFFAESGMSQKEAAKLIGIHEVTLCNLLRGKTQKNSILQIEEFLERMKQNSTHVLPEEQ